MSSATALTTVLAFAATDGPFARRRSSSSITVAAIVQVFFITAAAFGALSACTATPRRRTCRGMGSFLMMGLIGLIIASVVNIFLASSAPAVRHLGRRRADLRRPDRLGHAAPEERVHLRSPDDSELAAQGLGDGRAVALPELHQHVPDAAVARRPARTSNDRSSRYAYDEGPGRNRGPFRLRPENAAPMSLSYPARRTEADLGDICRIYAHAVLHGTSSFELEPPGLAEMTARWRAVSDGGFPYLVARAESGVIGYAYAGPYRPRPAYRHTVEDSIYVDPAAHGRGVGRALLQRLIATCEAAGLRRMVAVIGDSASPARSACTPPAASDGRDASRRLEARPLARPGADAAPARRGRSDRAVVP